LQSLRSTAFIAGVLGQSAKEGKERRLKEAQEGIVTWQMPADIREHISTTMDRRQKILDELDERMTMGQRADSSAKTDEDEAKAMGAQQEERDAAEEDKLLDEELKSLAAQFGWDGSKPPATDADREFWAAEDEYEQLMGRKSLLREDADDDERRLSDVAKAIDASGDVEPPKAPEKDLDEVTKKAEEAVLAQSLGDAPLSDLKSERDRNEQIMKQVNVEKGLRDAAVAQNEKPLASESAEQDEAKKEDKGRPKDDAPKE
jgi:hypothetical protein